jgi:hypothetical protein
VPLNPKKIEVTVNLFGTRCTSTVELPFNPTDAEVEYFVALFKQKMLEMFEADTQKLLLEGGS